MPTRAIQAGEALAGIADLIKRGQPVEDENGPSDRVVDPIHSLQQGENVLQFKRVRPNFRNGRLAPVFFSLPFV